MKKHIISIFLSFSIVIGFLPVTAGAAITFSGGNGTSAAPWMITEPEQLAALAQEVNVQNQIYNSAHYVLMNNLNLSAYGKSYNGGKGWTPIGTIENAFKGIFDGGGNTITWLYINDPDLLCAGLFGHIEGARVENLGLAGADINGGELVGGIAGSVYDGVIENCYVAAEVKGLDFVGGIVGIDSYNSLVKNCYVSGKVIGGEHIGGIAGSVSGGILDNCYAVNEIRGERFVGGVSGLIIFGTMKDCYALNSGVIGKEHVGRGTGEANLYMSEFTNNSAWIDMTVNGSIISSGAPNDENGASITTEEAKRLIADLAVLIDREIPVPRHFTPFVLGDCNRDGKVDIADLTYFKRYLSGWSGFEEEVAQMDYNKDGEVNALDLTGLKKYLAEKD